ncbi:hypothetical protein NDU88_006940 [Pleurodeles waltl]|uniref:Uncharacterized protein n=1 Tax=Pleurodeles waltl TaxID=8319 RepID=A0AAV7NZJ5_PLEWA|nr:hypothetical protein NDU88_006940 [Pleurodeles waltl]
MGWLYVEGKVAGTSKSGPQNQQGRDKASTSQDVVMSHGVGAVAVQGTSTAQPAQASQHVNTIPGQPSEFEKQALKDLTDLKLRVVGRQWPL